jgi:hypothetical protein
MLEHRAAMQQQLHDQESRGCVGQKRSNFIEFYKKTADPEADRLGFRFRQ